MQRAIQTLFLAAVAGLATTVVVAIFDGWSDGLFVWLRTAGAFAVASGIGMAAWRAWTGRRIRVVALSTLAAAIASLGLLLYEIWTDDGVRIEVLSASIILAVTGGLVCTLALAELRPRFLWIRTIAVVAIVATSGFTLYEMVLGENLDELGRRLWALAAVGAAAGLVVTPILHGVSVRLLRPDPDSGPSLVRCPHCGNKLPTDLSQVF